MKKKAIKKTKSSYYLALESAAACFESIYRRQMMRDSTPMSRMSRGMSNGAATSLSDFKADFELLIRRILRDHDSILSFYRWLFAAPKPDADGIERKMGTEVFATRIGSQIEKLGLIPRDYFKVVLRSGKNDKSPLVGDVPRQKEITAKYERLRKNFEQMKAQRDIQDAHDADEAAIQHYADEDAASEYDAESERETSEREPAEPDLVSLDGVNEYAEPEGVE